MRNWCHLGLSVREIPNRVRICSSFFITLIFPQWKRRKEVRNGKMRKESEKQKSMESRTGIEHNVGGWRNLHVRERKSIEEWVIKKRKRWGRWRGLELYSRYTLSSALAFLVMHTYTHTNSWHTQITPKNALNYLFYPLIIIISFFCFFSFNLFPFILKIINNPLYFYIF